MMRTGRFTLPSPHYQYPLQRTAVFHNKYCSIPYYVQEYSILSTGAIQAKGLEHIRNHRQSSFFVRIIL